MSVSFRIEPIVTAVANITATIIKAKNEYALIRGNSLAIKKTIVYTKIDPIRNPGET